MRYGENILEVAEKDEWTCPVCRGLCNCSNHRIRRGWAPTGSLYRRAIAEGEPVPGLLKFQAISSLLAIEWLTSHACLVPVHMFGCMKAAHLASHQCLIFICRLVSAKLHIRSHA